ncbi:unnamed protein product [Echinostoma caproni]|uniref:Ras-associating domain-containing protein n=1 Tax=Echinostoma caproni TaxID=27848 RepID=A0A183A7A1_9TREM|nr:unnamed protein product [Echinostoma caproni]
MGTLHYSPYTQLIDRKDGFATTGRSAAAREQKSVHWPSELNSSSQSSDYNQQQSGIRARHSTMLPIDNLIQMQKRQTQRLESISPSRFTLQGRQYEPSSSDGTSGPPRREIQVKRSHSMNPSIRPPVRSPTFPVNLPFPLTLADLTKQQPYENNNNNTSANTKPNHFNFNSASHFDDEPNLVSIPVPITLLSSTDNSSRYGLGMVRSHSATPQLIDLTKKNGYQPRGGSFDYDPTRITTQQQQQQQQLQRSRSACRDSPCPIPDENGRIKTWNPADLNPYRTTEVSVRKGTDKLILRVYHPNRTTKAVSVGPDTTTLSVIETLLEKNNLTWSKKYALVEKIPSMKLDESVDNALLLLVCVARLRTAELSFRL